MEASGAYRTDRAAALSGVPRSTVYQWARSGVLVPSVSREKVLLWSFADLMGLRVVYWLRQPKRDNGIDVPATSMPAVKRALDELRRLELPLWDQERSAIVVDRSGRVLLERSSGLQTASGQLVLADVLNVLQPFDTELGIRGPDLIRPRPAIRIHPGRLAGSPHIEDTRIETRALGALCESGLSNAKILALYPFLSVEQISESLDLEAQLTDNLRRAA